MPGDPGAAWPVAITPGFALSIIVSLLCGLVYHALFGQGRRGLGLSLLAGLLGFTGGEAFARWSGVSFGTVGSVHLLHGLAGAFAALVIAGFIERLRAPKVSKKDLVDRDSASVAAKSPPDNVRRRRG